MADLTHNTNSDELLSAYIDGELTDAERAAVEARLETDPAARELVAEMRSLSGTLKALPREALTEDLRQAVLEQVGDREVSLPRVELTMARRLMWPAIAIAAALMLMFVQDNQNREVDKIAKVDAGAAEPRERWVADEAGAAFEAPAEDLRSLDEVAAPVAPESAAGELARMAEADALPADALPADASLAGRAASPVLDEAAEEPAVAARHVTDALAASEAELEGVVHLTLTDFRSGAERFNRLLVSNGVQLVEESPPVPAAAAPTLAAPTADSFESGGRVAGTMSTRNAAPAGGVSGGVMPTAPADGTTSSAEFEPTEPEMVLVEAPPAQIEQILVSCAQDTEAIEEVTVDPTASGMNTAPAQQRLSDLQQYSRSSGKLALGSEYNVTPQQQGVIAALNSLPKQATAEEDSEQQQGWAARFYAGRQPVQSEQLNSQYNQYRNQYFDNRARQQAVARGEGVELGQKLAKDKTISEQPLRVLFLLHPSQGAAKK